MSLDSKVVWSEGMFLNPQHFQQQERYFERFVNAKSNAFGMYGWGLSEFELDHQLLKLGKLSVISAKGVFPDGTPFSIPDLNEPPPVMDVPEITKNSLIRLGIPVKRPGAVELLPREGAMGLARYYPSSAQVRDITEEEGENLELTIANLRLKLLLDGDDLSGYTTINVARINECREDKDILLDDFFIPSCLDINVSARLSGFLTELVGLLRHRADAISGRLSDSGRGATAEIHNFLMLQVINRIEPLVNHLSSIRGLHPERLFSEILQMVGELATFVNADKRPPVFSPYQHDDLSATFSLVMSELRQYLTTVSEETAIALSLEETRFGIRVSEIRDRSLISTSTFVLAAKADVSDDIIRTRFPAQIKIGPVERIRQLINAAMPGIQLRPLPVAPRQIPFRSGYTYFELDRASDFWKDLQSSGAFALHIGAEFPGLEMEFWAIRQ